MVRRLVKLAADAVVGRTLGASGGEDGAEKDEQGNKGEEARGHAQQFRPGDHDAKDSITRGDKGAFRVHSHFGARPISRGDAENAKNLKVQHPWSLPGRRTVLPPLVNAPSVH